MDIDRSAVSLSVAPADAIATPEAAARMRAQAAGAARLHLERHARRVRRGRIRETAWAARPLDDLAACALDLETTGSHSGAAIVEVGCVQVHGDVLGREFESLVAADQPLGAAAFAVHGIAPERIAAAPPLASVLPSVAEMVGDRVVIAHNAGFDVGFLRRAFATTGRGDFAPIVIDTVALARVLLGGRCGLGHAAHRLGIDAPHLHRALPDARLAAFLWLALVEILREEGAEFLGQVPGAYAVDAATAVVAPRMTAAAIAARLAHAATTGTDLVVAMHATVAEPALQLRVRAVRPVAAQWLVFDLDRRTTLVLDPARFDWARDATGPACQAPPPGV